MTRPAPSGDDVSYVAVQSSDTISRDRIRSALAVAGIAVTGSVAWHDENGAPGRWQLIEVDGFVAVDDERLARLRRAAGAATSGASRCWAATPGRLRPRKVG